MKWWRRKPSGKPQSSTFSDCSIGSFSGTIHSTADVLWDDTTVGEFHGEVNHEPRDPRRKQGLPPTG